MIVSSPPIPPSPLFLPPQSYSKQSHHPPTARSRACQDHACRADSCPSVCAPASGSGSGSGSGLHCARHACPRKGCRNPKPADAAACADHACPVDGCRSAVVVVVVRRGGAGAGAEACALHTCRADGCVRAQDGGGGGLYCADHACRWSFKTCRRQAGKGREYCDSHGCAVASCPLPCRRAGRLCADHGCWFVGGDGEAAAAECPSGPKGLGRFCAAHTCRVRACLEAVAVAAATGTPRRFCAGHACAWEGDGPGACPARRRGGGGFFCEGHACARRGCVGARGGGAGSYCAEHERPAKEGSGPAATVAGTGSSVVGRSRRAGPVPAGQLARMFQEDPRAVYAMAYTQGWEGKGGRERYDRLRGYLDKAMESQLRLWSLETEGMEEPRLILQEAAAEEVTSPVAEEMERRAGAGDARIPPAEPAVSTDPAAEGTEPTTS